MIATEAGYAVPALFLMCAAALAGAFASMREARRLRAQLAAERQRTELVIRATQTGIIDWDVASSRIDYSERFKEILGFPLNADLSDRTRHFDNVHPEDRERARAAFVGHLRAGRDLRGEGLHPPIEYRMRRADGNYAWVRGTGLSLRDPDGRTTRYIGSIIDISERKNQEHELETQRQRLELVVSAAQAGIVDWDGVTRQGWFSGRLKEMLGYSADTDTSGWTFFDRVHADDREGVRAALVAHLKGKDSASRDSMVREFRMLRADGRIVWVQAMGLSLRDESGRSARFLAAITDISERQRQAEALREQMDLTRDLIRALPNPLFLKDENFRFVHVNPAWEKVAAVSAERALGRTNLEVYPEAYAKVFEAQDQDLLAEKTGVNSIEVSIPGRNGPRQYILTKCLLKREDGSLRGMVGSMTDITRQKRIESQLRDQEQRLSLVVRASKVGIIDWDAVAKTAWHSERYKTLLGYAPDTDTSGWPDVFDLIHPEDKQRVYAAHIEHLKNRGAPGGESLHGATEYRLRRADGSYLWVQGIGLSLCDQSGRATRFLAAITDISERRAQEQALREQIRLTQDIIGSNPNPIFIKDAECRFVDVNPAWLRHTGIPAEMAIGKTVSDLFPSELSRSYDAQDRALLARGEGVNTVEIEVPRADGTLAEVIMSKSVLKRADGSVRGIVGTITDISQIKEIGAQLRESEERMRFWLENIPIPIAIYDPEGGVQFLNSAFVSTFGWTMEEMRGKRMPFVPEHRKEQLAGVLHNLLTVGKDAFETERMTKDGRVLDIFISTGMARAADGTPRATMVSLMDVTERKVMERQLSASREEALQAAQAKAAFLAAMSHEIRTPLNGVLGMAGLLAETELTGEQREYVDTVRVSGDALLSVINDILDYSKIESGRMEIENEPFEPMRAVEEAMEILGERARGKRLELAAEAEDSVPAWASGDLARLRQVLVNLVGNAVKFTERGEVVVRLRAPRAGSIEIEVRDTGIGIPKDRLASLFQAFTQADASTTRKYGGTGLGLAISKRLVELMGGELRADSEPGRGSTFVFNVNARACDAPPAAAIAAQPVELTGRRILIVDDNATNLRILRRQLERWGAVPVAASGGAAALSLLEGKERFDAALLDYHMPEMDGVMLARRIKTRAKSLPLVLLSSSMYRRAEEAEAGLFVVQLLKPVRQQQLREAMVTALGGAAPARKGRSPLAAGAGPAHARLRVLVVDDVDANCRLARALLRKFGHVSEVASSGLEAVEMAATGRYDVILMDVQMPDIDGMDATRRIRARLGAAMPRVIAVTANAMPGDRERCLAAGMDDYLSKPIQHQALRAAIEQAGGGAAESAARRAEPVPEAAPTGAIDWSRIESLAPFDPDGSMVAGAIAAFLADAPGRIKAMRAAYAAADAADAAAAAHALKGAAANIGAARLQELAQGIEALAREGRLDDARKSIGGLENALAEARALLAAKGKASP